MFAERMFTEAIPERVYALCKLLENKSLSSEEARESMEPQFLLKSEEKSKTLYFQRYLNAAIELELIVKADGILSLSVGKSVLKSIDTFRCYVIQKLEKFKNGLFYKVTKKYMDNGLELCMKYKNISNSVSYFSDVLNDKVVEDDMRAWRFWVSFLGIAYVQNMNVIPNAADFLWDLIKICEIQKKKIYSMTEFIDELRPYCNILIDSNTQTNNLNIAVSNGLRTLHDQRKIHMQKIDDFQDVWTMDQLDKHFINRAVTHVEILK